MKQLISLEWYPIAFGEMPDDEGVYLVAFDDGSVESYPMDHDDITRGEIGSGRVKGIYWANPIPHPDDM